MKRLCGPFRILNCYTKVQMVPCVFCTNVQSEWDVKQAPQERGRPWNQLTPTGEHTCPFTYTLFVQFVYAYVSVGLSYGDVFLYGEKKRLRQSDSFCLSLFPSFDVSFIECMTPYIYISIHHK